MSGCTTGSKATGRRSDSAPTWSQIRTHCPPPARHFSCRLRRLHLRVGVHRWFLSVLAAVAIVVAGTVAGVGSSGARPEVPTIVSAPKPSSAGDEVIIYGRALGASRAPI